MRSLRLCSLAEEGSQEVPQLLLQVPQVLLEELQSRMLLATEASQEVPQFHLEEPG